MGLTDQAALAARAPLPARVEVPSGWAYALMLLFVLACVLPLIPVFRLHHLLRHGPRVLGTIVVAMTPFIVWDALAARAGHWWYDEAQVSAGRLLGMPPEEWAFFLVIPLACIITWEAVGVVLGWAAGRRGRS